MDNQKMIYPWKKVVDFVSNQSDVPKKILKYWYLETTICLHYIERRVKTRKKITDSLALLKAVIVVGKGEDGMEASINEFNEVANYFTDLGIHTFRLCVNR